jgi:hypothetical protein
MRGDGAFADLVARRFAIACRKFGLKQGERTALDCGQFVKPPADAAQQSLF